MTGLRLLFVVEATFAGVGRHVIDLGQRLLERGHGLHLVYSTTRIEDRFRSWLESTPGLHRQPVDMAREPGPADAAAIARTRRYLRRAGPFDLVHGHSAKGGAVARIAALGLGVRRVYTPHALASFDRGRPPVHRRLYAGIEGVLGRTATDALVACAPEEAEEAVRIGVPADRIHVIPHGIVMPEALERDVARSQLGLGPDEVCLMWVGRLAPQKAPERFVRLIRTLARQHDRVRGVMIGSGPLAAEVRQLRALYGLEGRLVLTADENAAARMSAADVCVMTSAYEGLSYVLLEAQACGLPIVATEVGGLSTVVEHGVQGFRIAQGDEEGLARAVGRLCVDAELRQTMRDRAVASARVFSIDRMVDSTESLYRRLLEAPRRGVVTRPWAMPRIGRSA